MLCLHSIQISPYSLLRKDNLTLLQVRLFVVRLVAAFKGCEYEQETTHTLLRLWDVLIVKQFFSAFHD